LAGALRDRDKTETEIPAAPRDAVNFAENARHVAYWLLRRKGVGFFKHKPKRVTIDGKQVVENIGNKAGLFGLAHFAEVENGGNGRGRQKLAKRMSGLAGNRDVGVWPAENRDWKARRFAVCRCLQSPPHGQGVENDNAALHLQEPFNDAFGGIGLAAPFLTENGDIGVKGSVGYGVSVGHRLSLVKLEVGAFSAACLATEINRAFPFAGWGYRRNNKAVATCRAFRNRLLLKQALDFFVDHCSSSLSHYQVYVKYDIMSSLTFDMPQRRGSTFWKNHAVAESR
jgi:hypothetical protein